MEFNDRTERTGSGFRPFQRGFNVTSFRLQNLYVLSSDLSALAEAGTSKATLYKK